MPVSVSPSSIDVKGYLRPPGREDLGSEEGPRLEPDLTERVTVTHTRKSYPQDWPNYNKAQMNEKRDFQILLHDLCQGIPAPAQPGKGRPAFPMSDALFAIVFKTYSTFSGRRFMTDLESAKEHGHISKVAHYNTIFKYIEDPELFPILTAMIEQSSLSLQAVEHNFAVDSTGFAFSRFVRWFDIKYNRYTREQQWIKAHRMCGIKTNVVTAVEIFEKDSGDVPVLPALVDTTAKQFKIAEVLALGRGNMGSRVPDFVDSKEMIEWTLALAFLEPRAVVGERAPFRAPPIE